MSRAIVSPVIIVVAMAAHTAWPRDLAAGSAVVRSDTTEYLIPIECNVASHPERGFSTEPSRITREATGRTSGVNLRLQPWRDTNEMVITFNGYTAWIPRPDSQGPILTMRVAMSPISAVRDGLPTTMTYDMWTRGDRPAGITIEFEANCVARDPAAPSSRRLP